MIAVGGWIASGKSTLARSLARAFGAHLLVADRMREALLSERADHESHEAAWTRSFAAGFTEEIYEELLAAADAALAAGRSVVLDGCFATRRQRLRAAAVAAARGADFAFVECRVPRPVLEARLRERAAAAGRAPEAWLELLDSLAARWEPVDELPEGARFAVDNDGDPDRIAERLCAALGGGDDQRARASP